MEVQEFALRHLVAQLTFQRNQSGVVDRRGELAAKLHDLFETSSASLDATAAEATTADGMSRYRIGMAQLLAMLNVEGLDEGSQNIQTLFQAGMELLDSPALGRVVAHTSDIAAVPSFEELRDALQDNLSSDPSRIREAVGVPLSDVGWSYDFRDDHWVVEVRLGPMREAELRQMFEAPEPTDFPAASLFIDVKVVRRAEGSSKSPLDLWASVLERNREITQKLSAWLGEALA